MTPTRSQTSRPNEVGMYFRVIAALFLPGYPVPVFDTESPSIGAMTGWSDDELRLLIDEGHRQIDAQAVQLEALRGRSQIVLTTATAVLGLIIAGAKTIAEATSLVVLLVWVAAFTVDLLAVLGAAAVITVRKDMGAVSTERLSNVQPPVALELASSYARIVRSGQATIAREVTVFRDAVLLLIVSAVLYSVAWYLAVT